MYVVHLWFVCRLSQHVFPRMCFWIKTRGRRWIFFLGADLVETLMPTQCHCDCFCCRCNCCVVDSCGCHSSRKPLLCLLCISKLLCVCFVLPWHRWSSISFCVVGRTPVAHRKHNLFTREMVACFRHGDSCAGGAGVFLCVCWLSDWVSIFGRSSSMHLLF